MRTVGLETLKNKLREYVLLAAGGETVLVTDRDRVLAELVRPAEGRSPVAADALLADAVRHNLVTPPLIAPGSPPPRRPVAPWKEIAADLEASRAER